MSTLKNHPAPARQPWKNLVLTPALAAAVLLLTPDIGRADPPIEQVYNIYCAQCHGLKRNGTGINLPGLSVRPRDHTDSKGMGDTPDEELFKAIKLGGLAVNKSVLMPTWGAVLSDQQITEMVKYLRQVCHCGT
jgi:cytochrome c oxidase cbb3-type subunit 3